MGGRITGPGDSWGWGSQFPGLSPSGLGPTSSKRWPQSRSSPSAFRCRIYDCDTGGSRPWHLIAIWLQESLQNNQNAIVKPLLSAITNTTPTHHDGPAAGLLAPRGRDWTVPADLLPGRPVGLLLRLYVLYRTRAARSKVVSRRCSALPQSLSNLSCDFLLARCETH